MKQRLTKAFLFMALLISVFLFNSIVVLADDSTSSSDFISDLVVYGAESDLVSPLTDLPPYFYQGSSKLSTRTTFGYVLWSNMVGNQLQQYEARGTYEFNVPVMFSFSVVEGHTYNGQIRFPITLTMREMNPGDEPYQMSTLNISGMTQESLYDGVSFSYYNVLTPDGGTTQPRVEFWVAITFNSFQPSFTGTCYLNAMFEVRGALRMDYTIPENNAYIPTAIFNASVPTDYVGDLFDYPTEAIVDSTGTLITEQTIIQQQIANEQSQQSAEQHDNLVNGYDNSSNDSMLADKNTVLQGFEQQQDQAINSGQQYVSDFSAGYDTGRLQAMAPAFMFISTWFNDLWGGMGNFSTVLVVGLMLCVAGYILKLKH